MEKLIAVDGNSLMHRAFYALPSMTTKTGTPTGAIYGFLSMLFKLIELRPDYLVVAFDMHGPTFRHEAFKEYKEGRKETPEDLRPQFPKLKELLRAMGIAVCECERYEADDILGTFSRIAGKRGIESLLVTGDRDALQLIDDKTHVLLTKKGISETVEYDESVLMEQFGLAPVGMLDLKGLMGDHSDNIPGVPGVGEKTALKLLSEYKTLENTLAHAGEVKGKLGEKLSEFADQARFSYKLGIIDRNAPVKMSIEDVKFAPEKLSEAIPLMHELELRSLINRLPEQPAVRKPDKAFPVRTEQISSIERLKDVISALLDRQTVAMHMEDTLFLAADSDNQYEIVLSGTLLDPGLDRAEVFRLLKPVFESEGVKKLLFDAKRYMHLLSEEETELKGPIFDAMIADYLLHAVHPALSLKTLCSERFAGQSENPASALFRLYDIMQRELNENELDGLYREIELPLIRVLFEMEREGFMVDTKMLLELRENFSQRLERLGIEIYEMAGCPFNILSTKQLGAVLFEKLGLPPQKKTRTGYSTDAEVLDKLETMHPIIPLIIEYRTVSKLKSTFLDGLLSLEKSGRVHTSFNQNVTATGRISSTEPNLQNIPVRTELGREIRKAFIASPGNVLVGADYSQIELRLLAHMSKDERLIAAFNGDADIHARTAAEVFGVGIDEVTSQQRNAAKAVNFGIVYGISDFGLARNLSISRKEASLYIELYLSRYPGVKRYMKESIEAGRKKGYVKTLFGRRRELPEINASNFNTRSFGERVALNMPIQGTAADIIKLAMVRTSEAMKKEGLKAKLVLQIHDELIIDAPEGEAQKVAELLEQNMRNVIPLSVPLNVDVKCGHSWYDTK
ncbi:MAG: DNA polymerase I [Firmicutes bacterium ADurb.Bin182]|nr:MAG: DNA polymerase I [Firmicutes bacterium ADurb.Bin182]